MSNAKAFMRKTSTFGKGYKKKLKGARPGKEGLCLSNKMRVICYYYVHVKCGIDKEVFYTGDLYKKEVFLYRYLYEINTFISKHTDYWRF